MTPAKMFDGDLWVLASDVMQLVENAYKNGQTDEREACAKVCENEAKEHEQNIYDARDGRYDWQADGANACAVAIRARGNT